MVIPMFLVLLAINASHQMHTNTQHVDDSEVNLKMHENQNLVISRDVHQEKDNGLGNSINGLKPSHGLRNDLFDNLRKNKLKQESNKGKGKHGRKRKRLQIEIISVRPRLLTTGKQNIPPELPVSRRKRTVLNTQKSVLTPGQIQTKKVSSDDRDPTLLPLDFSQYNNNENAKLTSNLISKNKSDKKCILKPTVSSLSQFRHLVYYKHLNFVYLNLQPGKNVSFLDSELIVENTKWVWTFYGPEGALEFLKWPAEFNIWSMGLLDVFTYTIDIKLYRVKGNCLGVTVGHRHSDLVIGRALSQLSQTLMNFSHEYESKYGPSFFCYKKRKYINPKSLYILCKNIMCPLESLEYECCNYYFDSKKLKRQIGCNQKFQYDSLWWIVPTVVASIVFASCPLLILSIAVQFSDSTTSKTRSRSACLINNDRCANYIYLDDKYPLTVTGTLFSPVIALLGKITHGSRLVRSFIPVCSLGIILLQILLDYLFLYDMVLSGIQKGVFLGFRSAIAGYTESSKYFMTYLGGPYIALTAYLVLTCLFMAVPDCLSDLLEKGLAHDRPNGLVTTILSIDLKTISHFGSVSIVNTSGYNKIYSTFRGQFFMLLNFEFWKYIILVFTARWQLICRSRFLFILMPFYIGFCLIELAICIIINSLPIVSFGLTISKAYITSLSSCISFRRPRLLNWVLKIILNTLLIACVLYFLFMFCSICFDACLFVTRVFMFTYTGIIIYPKESYGYLIFIFTVLYYLVECANNFSVTYRKLLQISIRACESVQRVNDLQRLVDVREDCKGLHKLLFCQIVEVHRPKRRQVFVSFFKLSLILATLGISLNLLTKTDRFMQLNTLVHVGTALFTCAMPTIFMKMCRSPDERYKQKLLKREIMATIEEYTGYLQAIDTELSSD